MSRPIFHTQLSLWVMAALQQPAELSLPVSQLCHQKQRFSKMPPLLLSLLIKILPVLGHLVVDLSKCR